MALSKIILTASTILREFFNPQGNKVTVPKLSLPRLDYSTTNPAWGSFSITPSATTSTADFVNKALTSATAGSIDANVEDEVASAYAFIATARKKDGATTDLVNNTILFKVNNVEIGRISVSAATQRASWLLSTHEIPDTRFAMNGTIDLTIVITTVDPALEILGEMFGENL